VDSAGLRPTGDRLREVLFAWLQPFIVGSRVLDLFAGSGALGFEAASRGAGQVTMVEKSPNICNVLQQNATQLKLDNVAIACADALQIARDKPPAVDSDSRCGRFDIVFIDPPFDKHLHQQVIEALLQGQCLSQNCHVVIESSKREELPLIPHTWQLKKEKIAGEVRLRVYLVV